MSRFLVMRFVVDTGEFYCANDTLTELLRLIRNFPFKHSRVFTKITFSLA